VLATLESIIYDALAERYAEPVVARDGDVLRVLDGKPLSLARARARERGYSEEDLERLLQPLDVATLPWTAVPADGLELWRHRELEGDAGELVTEIVAGDPPFQVMVEREGWALVRLVDGATGWARQELAGSGAAVAHRPDASMTDWRPAEFDTGAIAQRAEKMLDVPYRWGGTSTSGVDCSGLVQRSVWDVATLWMPRHSTALMKVGVRVSPSKIERGDVLVLRRSGSAPDTSDATTVRAVGAGGPEVHPMHVAIATSPEEVVHASRDAWKVVREQLASLRDRYDVLAVRRLGVGE
jgi:cell wall-associated NlpC family hydrolase